MSEGIPRELRERDQWVAWRKEERDGKSTKVPYRADGLGRASSTDPRTWASYEVAASASGVDGIGFVFTPDDPYVGVDLDECIGKDGKPHPAAVEIVRELGGYVERSPSGRGLHVIVQASLPGGGKRTAKTEWGAPIEIYGAARFFTMTGAGRGEPVDAQKAVSTFCERFFPVPERAPVPRSNGIPNVSDAELLDRARGAKNGSTFERLYRGDRSGYASDSEADLALCSMLAFWAGGDPGRIDRLFQGSGLMREKWQREDYRQKTLERALAGKSEFYEPRRAQATRQPASEDPDPEPRALIVRASSVRSRSIRWAWTGRLAVGYLTVQTGVEGLGKSAFAAWMLARLTRGELPGDWHGSPFDVLIVAREDGIADTWRPRLDLCGADLDRTAFLNFDALGPEWNLRDGSQQLSAAVEQADARAVFIDAALEHMPAAMAGESINSPAFVRHALAPLRTLTREREIVTVFSMHPPKARSSDFRDLVQASQAFSAIPRIGLLFAYHPEDDATDPGRRRVLIRGKGNLGRDPGALEFRIVEEPYLHDDGVTTGREMVADVGASGVTLADLRPGRMIGEREPTKAERAAELIAIELADGCWHDAQPIRDRLYQQGVNTNNVVNDAKRRIGVESRQRPGVPHGGWEWRIAPSGSPVTGSRDSETLTPCARVVCDTETLTAKHAESSINTVRVSEFACWDEDGSAAALEGSESPGDSVRACASEPSLREQARDLWERRYGGEP